jgi:hypothetical protein
VPIGFIKIMITALLIVIGAVLVLGSGIMLLGLAEAPEGWEDEDGFHLGPEPALCRCAVLASPLTEYRDDVRNAGFAETQAQCHCAGVAWPPMDLR